MVIEVNRTLIKPTTCSTSAGTDIYICSRPIQLLNILNIAQSGKINSVNGYLMIVGNFIVDKITKSKITKHYDYLFKGVYFFKSQNEILDSIDFKVERLLTYSDVGEEGLFIRNINPSMVVIYEEGYAAYHLTFAYSILSKIKFKIKKKSVYIGGSPITDELVIYHPDVYSKIHRMHASSLISSFRWTLNQVLKYNKNQFYDIFNYEKIVFFRKSTVLLYLLGDPSTTVDFLIDLLKKNNNYDHLLIKKHPGFCYSQVADRLNNLENVSFIESNIPVEYIVYDCFISGALLDLYHETSTTAIYMKKYINNIVEIDTKNSNFKKGYKNVYKTFFE